MFSLRMLLVVVALAALYIAGMVYRTEWWEASILTLTYLIYAAAISAAFLAKEHRAFFLVFAVFGVAYGVCVYVQMDDRMVTDWVLAEVRERVHKAEAESAISAGRRPPVHPSADPFDESFPRLKYIGHSFFAVMISLVAGVVAEAVVRRKQKTVT
jgi:hypothetical protein